MEELKPVTIDNLKNNGEVLINLEERYFLNQAIQGEFKKHSVFDGIEVRQLNIDNIPLGIMEKVQEVNGRITSFNAIKIIKEVLLHQHTIDGEIYFGGNNGVVTLLNSSKEQIGQFDLKDNSFTRVTPGEWHEVKSSNDKGSIFFGVKFETTK